jgi:hypothetical protein
MKTTFNVALCVSLIALVACDNGASSPATDVLVSGDQRIQDGAGAPDAGPRADVARSSDTNPGVDAAAADAESKDAESKDAGKDTTPSGDTTVNQDASPPSDGPPDDLAPTDLATVDTSTLDASTSDALPPATSGYCGPAQTWSLPTGVASWDDWMDQTEEEGAFSCATNYFRARVLDLDGDAKPDLVVTDSCDTQGVGHTHWKVYKNTGSGFAGTPTTWSLPTGVASWDDWMDQTQEEGTFGCATNYFRAQVLDIDGDAKPDLLVTDSCDTQGVGHTHWKVYKNTGSGFAGTPTPFALPTGVASWDDWMDQTQEEGPFSCATNYFRAQVLDTDGDAKPDLLVTDSCDTQGAGHTHWKVYKNTGSGFSGTPITFALPTGVASWDDWMDQTQEEGPFSCATNYFRAQVLDLDGDAKPDLVVTDSCDTQGAGHTHWKLFANTGCP